MNFDELRPCRWFWTHVSGVTLPHEPHAEDGDLDAALGLGLGGHPGYECTVRVLRCVEECGVERSW